MKSADKKSSEDNFELSLFNLDYQFKKLVNCEVGHKYVCFLGDNLKEADIL